MDKPWLASYQSGIPEEIDPTLYTSLVDLFHQSCDEFKDLPAYVNLNHAISFNELRQQSQHIASFLQQQGIKKGDRVAIMLPNLLQYPLAIFAILQIGAVVVNTNPLYTVDELTNQLQDAEINAIFVLSNLTNLIKGVLTRFSIKTIIVTQVADVLPAPKRFIINFLAKYTQGLPKGCSIKGAFTWHCALKDGQKIPYQPIDINPQDLAFLQYTGGTTGIAKGAMLSHFNMIANVLQAYTWVTPLEINSKDIVVTALPLYHIFALTANCLTFLKAGAKNILITNPRDINGLIKTIKKLHFTAFTGVNTLFNALLNNKDFIKIDFSTVKLTLSGGMALQKAVAERWHHETQTRILEAYGLTETSPAVTINPMNLTSYNGSIGLPLSSTIVSIRDDNNKSLPTGDVGEICVFGPQVMRGYWKREADTKDVFTQDGFLKTGDLGTMDEAGFIYLVDRKKELIIVSGFNVYPNEVEQILTQHPDVLEAGVIGIQDDTGNERVKAFVVKRREDLTAEELISYCRQHLTPYKVPKVIEFRTELPKSNVGKILRRALA
ncbi:MAG: long-chain-fatty-acid--CoA ligase [Legionellales bacterium RIFCSPHIGHO2_12_FULL_37_14]|nr:MAG: long-chain-fatty-acid--CoA ligase [Legionellales bacterium RIFCSPHIGHO2_12_FULL_37_14]